MNLSGTARAEQNIEEEKTVLDEAEDTNSNLEKAETEREEEKRMTGKSSVCAFDRTELEEKAILSGDDMI